MERERRKKDKGWGIGRDGEENKTVRKKGAKNEMKNEGAITKNGEGMGREISFRKSHDI